MAGTDVSGDPTSGTPSALGVDMALEVVTLPVSDVDRAKRFYESLGWRFDIDLVVSDDIRTVQFTPPHSQCSIQFGTGRSTAEPGSAQAMILVVDDIEAARDDLVGRGVDVSEVMEARPPVSWPKVSLIRLKWSMSAITSANGVSLRRNDRIRV